jgi:serine/threonine-protein kinase
METPKYIGPYRVDCRLGAGGMGVVYRAHDDRLGRTEAIKCLLPTRDHLERQQERFGREARILGRLNHPNIVQVRHTLEHEGTLCIVMEYVDGETLQQRIASRGPLPVGEVVRLGRQIAEGMAAAHKEGIIHRDLKSENVLLDRNGNAKVTDFGVAKVLGDETLTEKGRAPGTLKAMSPEQLRGKKLTEASDLFSFGLLLYEALVGELPFTGSGIEQLVKAVTELPPPSLSARIPGLPAKLDWLVEQLLQKHPSGRPHDFREVIVKLTRVEAELDRATASLTAPALPALASDDESTEDPVQPARKDAAPAHASTPADPGQARVLHPSHGNTSRQLAASESSRLVPARIRGWRKRLAATAGAVVLLAVVAYALWPIGDDMDGQDARRVAVLPPDVPEDCAHGRKLVANRVRSAMQEPLFYLQGVFVISNMGLETQTEIGEAVGDEVLRAVVTCNPDHLAIEIQRQGLDGRLLVEPRSFELDISELGRSDTIQNNVRYLYQGFATRTDVPVRGAAQPADLEKFLRLSQAYWQKQPGFSREQILAEMEAIRKSSPTFLDAYIFAAEVLLHREDQAALDEAWRIMKEAEQIAPLWLPVLSRLFTIALARNDMAGAKSTLEKISSLDQGGGFTYYVRGLWRKRNQDIRGARDDMKTAAERHPSWRIRYHLASLDIAACDIEGAQQTLDALLTRWPDNRTVRQLSWMLLGRLDPLAAASSYASFPRPYKPFDMANQGVNLMNTRAYHDAIALLRQALAQDEDHVPALYSLAEAEKLVGESRSAEAHFAQVLAQMPADAHDVNSMVGRAMVLAHQGNVEEARQAIERALQRDDMEILYSAAVVYALIGDQAAAVHWTERALDCGYAEEWFHYPWFDTIRQSPQLHARIGRDGALPARQ